MNSKKIIFFTFFIICFWSEGYSQTNSSVIDIYKRGAEIIDLLEEKNFEFVRTEFDVLSLGDNSEQSRRTLHPNYDYVALIYHDSDIKEIDLKVYKSTSDGWEIETSAKQMKDIDNLKIVYLTTQQSTEYLFEVEVNDFTTGSGAGRYMLTLGHTGEKASAQSKKSNGKPQKDEDETVYRADSYYNFRQNINSNRYLKKAKVYSSCLVILNNKQGKVSLVTEGESKIFYLNGKTDTKEGNIILEMLDTTGKKWFMEASIDTGEIKVYFKNKDGKFIQGRSFTFSS